MYKYNCNKVRFKNKRVEHEVFISLTIVAIIKQKVPCNQCNASILFQGSLKQFSFLMKYI